MTGSGFTEGGHGWATVVDSPGGDRPRWNLRVLATTDGGAGWSRRYAGPVHPVPQYR